MLQPLGNIEVDKEGNDYKITNSSFSLFLFSGVNAVNIILQSVDAKKYLDSHAEALEKNYNRCKKIRKLKFYVLSESEKGVHFLNFIREANMHLLQTHTVLLFHGEA